MNHYNILFIQEIVPSYRVSFFEKLHIQDKISLYVVSSDRKKDEGFHFYSQVDVKFPWIKLPEKTHSIFGKTFRWMSGLNELVDTVNPEVIFTVGNKSFVQSLLIGLKRKKRSGRVYIMQHAKEAGPKTAFFRVLEFIYTRYLLTHLFDGIVVYTEKEKNDLISDGFPSEKLSHFENTIDTTMIMHEAHLLTYSDCRVIWTSVGIIEKPSLLFIGRLTPSKRVDRVLTMFQKIRQRGLDIQLIIIGDGSSRDALFHQANTMSGVVFLGEVYDEKTIAAVMRTVRVVFLPEAVGLSIVHAFAYGKPFVTYPSSEHRPEIAYLQSGINGYMLGEEDDDNADLMASLFIDQEAWERLSDNARKMAEKLSIDNMVNNFLSIISRQ